MKRPESETPAPFSLRLSQEERAELERRAGNMPLGEYIRQALFADDNTDFQPAPRRKTRRRKAPVRDHKILAQLMGELGRSHLASNLNQIARAANVGALPVTREVEKALFEACDEVRDMRKALLKALDYHGEEPQDGEDDTC